QSGSLFANRCAYGCSRGGRRVLSYFKITPAVAFGIGWYSFTSPFLANIAGSEEGVYGLLVNLLREQLTYITAPFLTKRFGKSLGCGWRRDDG
ncbi:MAG: LysO family transporter, partial [Pyrobaculum sp.]